MDTRKTKDLILINLTGSRIIKGIFVCSVLLCISGFAESDVSYACGGSSRLPCTIHNITCQSPLVINIISTAYGYRSGCNNTGGPTVCFNETCCDGQPNDCYIPFSNSHHQEVNAKCKEQSSCTMGGFLRNNIDSTNCSSQIVNAHSKINFNCIPVTEVNMTVTASLSTNGSTTIQTSTINSELTSPIFTSTYTRQSSTDRSITTNKQDSRSLHILGGVLGTFLLISIIIIVVLVVYFTRRVRKIKILSNFAVPEQSSIPPTTYDSLNKVGASAYYNINNETQEANPAQTMNNSEDNSQYVNSVNIDDDIYQNTANYGQKQSSKQDSQLDNKYYEPLNVNADQGNMSNMYVNY